MLKAFLGRGVEVMVAHIGWIRNDQVEPGFRLERGKVGFHHVQAAVRPELPGRFSETGVQLNSARCLDAITLEHIPQCRVERPCTNCRVQKPDALCEAASIPEHLFG